MDSWCIDKILGVEDGSGVGYGPSRSKGVPSLFTAQLLPYTSTRGFITPFVQICIQCLICMVGLVLGFCVSQQAQLAIMYCRQPGYYSPLLGTTLPTFENPVGSGGTHLASPMLNASQAEGRFDLPTSTVIKTGVSVGRHKILIRPWPHPDPIEMMQGYTLLRRVQLEQDKLHGVQDRKPIIAITPTFVRTFQAVHLTGLLHTLTLVSAPVTWIVIEAGGVTNETACLLDQAHVQKVVHIGFSEDMPEALEERAIVEARMRIGGLRYVREQRLDGIVIFVDESNIHSLQLFDEVQKVQWVGAFPVGMLTDATDENSASGTIYYGEQKQLSEMDEHTVMPVSEDSGTQEIQIQGPVCDDAGNLTIGWHKQEDVRSLRNQTTRKRRLEWAGFAVKARAVWEGGTDRPPWVYSWDDWVNEEGLVDIRNIVRNESLVEPLGSCGKKVLIWCAHMEDQGGIRHPAKWNIDPQLQIVVPAKRTPWAVRPIKPSSPLAAPSMDMPALPLAKEVPSPVVKADAGVPIGREAVLPQPEKPQGTLKSTGRTSRPRQRRRRRGRGNDKQRDLGVTQESQKRNGEGLFF